MSTAIVTISVASLHVQPDYESLVETQVLMGMPLEVMNVMSDWLFVCTIDGSKAYVHRTNVALAYQDWDGAPKLIVTAFYAQVFLAPDISTYSVCDLVAGNIVGFQPCDVDGFYCVLLPDGRMGFVSSNKVTSLQQWFVACKEPTLSSFIHTAHYFMGVPYTWGGASTKSVDCSGFLYVAAMLTGIVLPRNAYQQATIGERCDEDMLLGDLVFFGDQRITHIGIYLDDDNYLHAQGYVRISSLNPASNDYISRNKLLGATRIANKKGVLVAPRLEALWHSGVSSAV